MTANYTPSPEALALAQQVSDYYPGYKAAAERCQAIDQALDAARQQGRDEYRVHNARGEDGPCECGPCRRTLWAIENSQGAGLGSQPDQRASQPSASSEGGSGGDGSTVASPLRGTGEICPGSKRPPPMAASKVVCPECGQTVTVHPRRLDWSGVNDLYIWPHNRPETGNQPDQIQVPEGKVLVDREDLGRAVELAESAPLASLFALLLDRLRAALEGED